MIPCIFIFIKPTYRLTYIHSLSLRLSASLSASPSVFSKFFFFFFFFAQADIMGRDSGVWGGAEKGGGNKEG